MKPRYLYVILLFSSLSMTNCTQRSSTSSGSPLKSIWDSITSPSIRENRDAQKEIAEIQQELNQDTRYVLKAEDQELLLSQGLLNDKSELDGWVK